jgi:hypothetical protein
VARRGDHRARESLDGAAVAVQSGDESGTEQRLENRCGTGEASGKVFGGGAQRTGVATLRRRRRLGSAALRQRWWPPAVGEAPPRSCSFIGGEEGEAHGKSGGVDGQRRELTEQGCRRR